jgi:hypothetical protein
MSLLEPPSSGSEDGAEAKQNDPLRLRSR